MKKRTAEKSAVFKLLDVMAKLRSPEGCPWDREQTHMTLRTHAIEEVYEMIDAIEAGDDHELAEELGDLLLQVVFHAQLAQERGVFDFEEVCRLQVEKLIRRHPHVFGDAKAKTVDAVWAQWEKIKRSEKEGTVRERSSALDGIPKHLPALQRAEKLIKKARKAGLTKQSSAKDVPELSKAALAKKLFSLAEYAQSKGWSAEELLRSEIRQREKIWRRDERKQKS